MLGADLIAKAIVRQGVKTVFGLPGHLESVFGAFQREGVRLIHMRHESPCVLAADAYAQLRRGLGVAIVTAGPGLANAVGGIASAFDNSSPVLIIAGRNPTRMLDARPMQELDHVRLVRSVVKWAQSPERPARPGSARNPARCRQWRSGRRHRRRVSGAHPARRRTRPCGKRHRSRRGLAGAGQAAAHRRRRRRLLVAGG